MEKVAFALLGLDLSMGLVKTDKESFTVKPVRT